MIRYIDADLCKAYATDYYPSVAYGVKKIIDEQPTADVRENVKGEWLYKGLDFEIDSLYQCSACKHYHWSKSNYCPNCGADMRGDKDDNK